ncbi:MAG TPA: hypothetical protein VHB72_00500 [Candidatus Saccharimonadales bacterium]|nr:hypothetical protein [Candidatus Saccharimonadales bacterium]
MASTDSNNVPAPSFFIVYGWSEGPWQSKKMRDALRANGFRAAQRAAEADVIIAHSLGCYLVPRENHAKVVMLVGLPYWPGKPVLISVLQNTSQNIKNSWSDRAGWWLNKLLHNCWYILARPKASYYAGTRRKLSMLPATSTTREVLFIRNKRDTFCRPDIQNLIPSTMNYTYVQNVGGPHHEDCWLNPIPYVNLIRKSL